jgi:hypothetical protein
VQRSQEQREENGPRGRERAIYHRASSENPAYGFKMD